MENSPLGRLSPELRNKTYDIVFTPLASRHTKPNATKLANVTFYNGLTKTCRQLRRETSAMFWNSRNWSLTTAQNMFEMEDYQRIARSTRRVGTLRTILGKDVVSYTHALVVWVGIGEGAPA